MVSLLPRPLRFSSARMSSCLNTPVCLRPVEELADLDRGAKTGDRLLDRPIIFRVSLADEQGGHLACSGSGGVLRRASTTVVGPEGAIFSHFWCCACPVISLPDGSFFLYCRHQLTFHEWLLDLNNGL